MIFFKPIDPGNQLIDQNYCVKRFLEREGSELLKWMVSYLVRQ